MKKKKDLIIVLHYTTIATIKTTKKKQQKTKNLSEDIYTFFPVSLSDIVCTPRHFSSHLCLITGLFLTIFGSLFAHVVWLFIFFPFLSPQPFHDFFLLKFTISPTTSHLLSQSLGFFSGINPPHPWLEITQKEKKLHNYPFLTRRFFPGSLWLYSKLKPIHQYHPDFTDERNPSVLKLYTI